MSVLAPCLPRTGDQPFLGEQQEHHDSAPPATMCCSHSRHLRWFCSGMWFVNPWLDGYLYTIDFDHHGYHRPDGRR